MKETAIFIYVVAGLMAVATSIFTFGQLSVHDIEGAGYGLASGVVLTLLLWGLAHSIKGRTREMF